MDKKKLMLLGGACALALVSFLGLRSVLTNSSAPVAQAVQIVVPKGPKVLVAQRALPLGTIVTADAVGFQEWPHDMVRDAYFTEGNVDMNKLIGTVVRFPVTAGQPLTQGALVAPGDRGFLAAALAPGMRAMTITVTEKQGVAGFVFPGDHVDLMLTQSVHGVGSDNMQPLNVTETILQNIRVLATDQSPETETANGKTVVHTFHTVTLEVSARIAQKIEVAQTLGTIGMVLRSIADTQCDLDKDIASGKIQLAPTGTPLGGPAARPGDALAANPLANPGSNGAPCSGAHAGSEGPTSFETGGDVSRFGRRTMPKQKEPPPPTPGPHGPTIKVVHGGAVEVVEVGGHPDPNAAAMNALGGFFSAIGNGARRAGDTTAATMPATAAGF